MAESSLKSYFLLDPAVAFLNHGSFGACPKPVFEEYQRWQTELERQPVDFLQRRSSDLLLDSRKALASYLHTQPDSVVYVANATWGINVAIRSLDLKDVDEVLTSDQEYGANMLAWEWLLGKTGARLVRQPIELPVTTAENIVDQIFAGVTNRTRVLFLSHITSPTALIMPIEQICQKAKELGIVTIVDGAHAPGHIEIDFDQLGADIYAGNLHKWLCAPKGAGFLYVRPDLQDEIESLIVSWGWGKEGTLEPSTSFVERNEWQGTRDIAAFLSVPAAIAFQQSHDWPTVRRRCHDLASRTRQEISELTSLAPISPDSCDWFGQMIACPIATNDPERLQNDLYGLYQVEVPIGSREGRSMIRVSYQGYNSGDDADRLMTGLRDLL